MAEAAETPAEAAAKAAAKEKAAAERKEKQLAALKAECWNKLQAENGTFGTLAALITGFSLATLPSLRYSTLVASKNDTLAFYENCDDSCFDVFYEILPEIQSIMMAMTALLSTWSALTTRLMVWKGQKKLTKVSKKKLTKVPDPIPATCIDCWPRAMDIKGQRRDQDRREGYEYDLAKQVDLEKWCKATDNTEVLERNIHSFFKFWNGHRTRRKCARGALFWSVTTFTLAAASSPYLFCHDCALGCVVSGLLVLGAIFIVLFSFSIVGLNSLGCGIMDSAWKLLKHSLPCKWLKQTDQTDQTEPKRPEPMNLAESVTPAPGVNVTYSLPAGVNVTYSLPA